MIQGLDLVEVSPPYDPAGVTTTLAARLVLDAMGFAMKSKSPQASVELWERKPWCQQKNEATKGEEGKSVWPFSMLICCSRLRCERTQPHTSIPWDVLLGRALVFFRYWKSMVLSAARYLFGDMGLLKSGFCSPFSTLFNCPMTSITD